jgi:transcriptional regulator with XRE-family HTH domain
MLSEYIKEQREKRGLSQSELARIAGLSATFINRLEQGNFKSCTIDSLTKLSRALKVPFNDLRLMASGNSKTTIPDKSTDEIMRELNQALPACIPIYNNLGDKQPAAYTYVPKALLSGGIRMQGIISDRDINGLIRKGDTLLVSRQLKPQPGDICVYEKDGKPVIEIYNKKVNTDTCGVVVQAIHKFRESWQ